MKSVAAGTTSGCVVWLLGFFFLMICLCPAAAGIGGVSSTVGADGVARIMGPLLCPADGTAEIITYQTTSTDEFGNTGPATGFAMQCVADDGAVVRAPSSDYAFYWVGLLVLGSIALASVAALILAAPLGGWIARRQARRGN